MQFKYLAILALSSIASAATTATVTVAAGTTYGNPYVELSSLAAAAIASISNTAPNPGVYGAAATSVASKEAAVSASISHDIAVAAASINSTASATAFGYSTVLAEASRVAASDLGNVAATLFNAAPAPTVMPGIIAAVGGAAALMLL